MKTSFSLSVPKPCHEKWEEFTSTEAGGFCSSCQKEVIDFTTWDEYQIKKHFKTLKEPSCGRFKSNQLRTYVIETPPSHTYGKWIPASLLTAFVAFYSGITYANTKNNNDVELFYTKTQAYKVYPKDSTSQVLIKGVVLSSDDSSSLAGINVVIKGTSFGVVTDINGEFEIEIDNPKINMILVFSAVGFNTIEKSLYEINMPIILDWDPKALNEVVITGGVCHDPLSPRNVWAWIVRLFRGW